MKKILLFASVAMISSAAMAQSGSVVSQSETIPALVPAGEAGNVLSNTGVAAKGTGLTDTLFYRSTAQASGPYSQINFDYALPIDSGRLYGPNGGSYKAWAQLYRAGDLDVSGNDDTTIQLLGLVAAFWGSKTPSSTKSVVLSVWKRNTTKVAVTGRTKFYIYGLPQAATVAAKTVPYTAITLATAQPFYFASPINGVNYDFYAGYSVAYTWTGLAGDTIGLINTQTAIGNTYTLETGTNDTLVNANNIMQNQAGTWKSTAYDLGITNGGDQVIYPIIKISCPACGVGVKSFTQNNLSFYGNYPNPAVNSTNIKFGLKKNADVNIQIMDVNGKLIQNIDQKNLSVGEHIVNVNTSAIATGTYVYVIRTSAGDGIASQLIIAK